MEITQEQQKLYDLAKAGKLLKKHDVLEKSQEDKIEAEKLKIKNK